MITETVFLKMLTTWVEKLCCKANNQVQKSKIIWQDLLFKVTMRKKRNSS